MRVCVCVHACTCVCTFVGSCLATKVLYAIYELWEGSGSYIFLSVVYNYMCVCVCVHLIGVHEMHGRMHSN